MLPFPSSGYRHTHWQNEYGHAVSLLPARTCAILPWENSTVRRYRHMLLLSSRGQELVQWYPAYRDTFHEKRPMLVVVKCHRDRCRAQSRGGYLLHRHIATPAKGQ